MRANQLRLWFASMAYVLLCALRRIGLAHTRFAKATCGSIRLKLLKIAALVRISVRRIKFAMASGCPYQSEFQAAHARLSAALQRKRLSRTHPSNSRGTAPDSPPAKARALKLASNLPPDRNPDRPQTRRKNPSDNRSLVPGFEKSGPRCGRLDDLRRSPSQVPRAPRRWRRPYQTACRSWRLTRSSLKHSISPSRAGARGLHAAAKVKAAGASPRPTVQEAQWRHRGRKSKVRVDLAAHVPQDSCSVDAACWPCRGSDHGGDVDKAARVFSGPLPI